MNTSDVHHYLVWSYRLLRFSPDIVFTAIKCRLKRKNTDTKIVVCLHHKVLTVYLGRVFRVFAGLTGRSYAYGSGPGLDYNANIIIDHHSDINACALNSDYVGIHLTRDPRDIIVSGAFYHLHSKELWLHIAQTSFNGKTYQQAISELATFEEQLLFELANAGGDTIDDMLAWKGSVSIREMKYNDLVSNRGRACLESATSDWPLNGEEKQLLMSLFDFFSIGNKGADATSRHIRDPKSGQWQEHFTQRVIDEFMSRFPDAVERLGYVD